MPDCYLASQSPRRKELLRQLAVSFEVLTISIDESVLPGEIPEDYVQRLAREKALAGHLTREGNAPVIGSDTAVVVGGEILGKPCSREESESMLKSLSGREHQVMTAVYMTDGQKTLGKLVISDVVFATLSEQQIKHYVASGEGDDKAGAYAIQGFAGSFVKELRGSYPAVVGLPLYETAQLLHAFGVSSS